MSCRHLLSNVFMLRDMVNYDHLSPDTVVFIAHKKLEYTCSLFTYQSERS